MDVIKHVKIKNYKGLETLNFAPASINILVGPNNTGKSSILEAIGLAVSSTSKFEDILETDILSIIGDRYDPRYLIHLGEKKSDIEIKTSKDLTLTLHLEYFEEGYPKNEVGDMFLDYINSFAYDYLWEIRPIRLHALPFRVYRTLKKLDEELKKGKIETEFNSELTNFLGSISRKLDEEADRIKQELINSEKLFIISEFNGRLYNVSTLCELYKDIYEPYFAIYYDEKFVEKIPIIFSSHKIEYSEDILTLYKKLTKNRMKFVKATGVLKERIPYFDDVIMDPEKDNLAVYLRDKAEPIPLSMICLLYTSPSPRDRG
mgnify:CR=1 FL=1